MIYINNHDQRCHLGGKEALKVVAMGREDWRQAIRRSSLSSSLPSPSSSQSSSSSSLLTTSGGHRAGARRRQWAKAADGTRPHGHPCRLLLDPGPHIFLVNIVSIIIFIGIAFMVSCRFFLDPRAYIFLLNFIIIVFGLSSWSLILCLFLVVQKKWPNS